MASETHQQQLEVFFFPLMAHGHIIPMIDMAKLFSSRGAKTTIITTPHNANLISKWLDRISSNSGILIGTKIVQFPVEAGLPVNCENLDQIDSDELTYKFLLATRLLEEPFEQLLQNHRPHCLISDMFLPWTTAVAAKFDVPRIIFHGTCFFSLCCSEMISVYKPHRSVPSDTAPFLIPNLPDEIELTKKQIPDFLREEIETEFTKFAALRKEFDKKSYGVVVNSFYELEPRYADHYRYFMGNRAWHIGSVSLSERNNEEKVQRGKKSAIDEHECLRWLELKKPNSVVYVCFGSTSNIPPSQLREIAFGLEASGQDFIWVVKKLGMKKQSNEEEDAINGGKWLPEGFEERIEGKGLIIQGWAPQLLILDHKSIGGFVTHCGWNSTLEGICAGVPMVTWPIFAEQFYNEKLITQILKIGVAGGAKEWTRMAGNGITREKIEVAVNRLMIGEESGEMRSRAKEFAEMAKKAVEEGGSSCSDLNALMEDLKLREKSRKKTITTERSETERVEVAN